MAIVIEHGESLSFVGQVNGEEGPRIVSIGRFPLHPSFSLSRFLFYLSIIEVA